MRRRQTFALTLATGCAVVAAARVPAQAPKAEAPPREAFVKAPAGKRAVGTTKVEKAVVLPAPAGAVNEQARERQMLQLLRPFLRVEYHVLRGACEPSPEQRRRIARAGERVLRDCAPQTPGNGAPFQVVINGQAPAPTPRVFDPVKPIREGLVKAAEQYLTPEQLARYKAELKRRDDHWKQSAVRSIVARLDQDLLLTAEQRASIGESLRDRWDGGWVTSVTALMNIEHYFPPIPDSFIVPFLDEPQKEAWEASRPNRRVVHFGIAANRGDDQREDEELTEAREAEDKAGARE
jgi:hypothetical protein